MAATGCKSGWSWPWSSTASTSGPSNSAVAASKGSPTLPSQTASQSPTSGSEAPAFGSDSYPNTPASYNTGGSYPSTASTGGAGASSYDYRSQADNTNYPSSANPAAAGPAGYGAPSDNYPSSGANTAMAPQTNRYDPTYPGAAGEDRYNYDDKLNQPVGGTADNYRDQGSANRYLEDVAPADRYRGADGYAQPPSSAGLNTADARYGAGSRYDGTTPSGAGSNYQPSSTSGTRYNEPDASTSSRYERPDLDYQPGASSYQPGATGYNPPGAAAYAPASRYGSAGAETSDLEPAPYRPGGTSDYPTSAGGAGATTTTANRYDTASSPARPAPKRYNLDEYPAASGAAGGDLYGDEPASRYPEAASGSAPYAE